MGGTDVTLEPVLRTALENGVTARGAHAIPARVLDDLDWRLAGRSLEGSPHTIQQIANHIVYWNGFSVALFEGLKPALPAHDGDDWPGPEAPRSAEEWTLFLTAYKRSFERLIEASRRKSLALPTDEGGRHSSADWIRCTLQHVSYHAGQIALLRRMMGSWPPPEAIDTW